MERVLQRQQGSYILAVEAGRQLLLSADAQAEALLQEELMELQELWRNASVRLDQRKKELLSLLKVTSVVRAQCLLTISSSCNRCSGWSFIQVFDAFATF